MPALTYLHMGRAALVSMLPLGLPAVTALWRKAMESKGGCFLRV